MFNVSSTGTIEIPKTITPISVWWWNTVISSIIFFVLWLPLGPFWATVFTLLGFAATIAVGIIAVDIDDYEGALLFNPFSKKRRAIFPGLHFKLPWEHIEYEDEAKTKKATSLKRLVSSEGVDNYPTNDPAENMEGNLKVHMRINTSGTAAQAADNFIRFRSIDEHALMVIVRGEIVKMFGAYYVINEMESLLDPKKIQEEVLANQVNKDKIEQIEKHWGISIGVVLESSDPDKATKDMKRTPSMTEALLKSRKRMIEEGVEEDLAHRTSLLLDPNTDYTETKFDLEIKAPDLKNLQHVSIVPLGGNPGAGKGGKKK